LRMVLVGGRAAQTGAEDGRHRGCTELYPVLAADGPATSSAFSAGIRPISRAPLSGIEEFPASKLGRGPCCPGNSAGDRLCARLATNASNPGHVGPLREVGEASEYSGPLSMDDKKKGGRPARVAARQRSPQGNLFSTGGLVRRPIADTRFCQRSAAVLHKPLPAGFSVPISRKRIVLSSGSKSNP